MLKRSQNEIFASILQSTVINKDGTKFTKLMYDSFLSYNQISHYLKDLIRFGLLVNAPDIMRYKITEKGLRFLELAENMDRLLRDLDPRT